jgi:uncharacterized membrane protein YphA (DoxX/SURF4 family)
MNTMKCRALFGLRLLLGLILFAAGSGQTGGLDLVVQQIQTIGPRQWLSLMAGSIVSSAPVISPVGRRIARGFPIRSAPFVGEEFAGGNAT